MSARTGIMEMPDAREHLEKLDEAMKRLHKASQVYVAKRREFSQVRCDLSIMARHLKLLYRFFNEDGAKGEDVVERLHKLNLLGLEMLQLHVEVDKEMAPWTKCEDPKVIGEWFTLIRNTMARYSIVDDDVYNFNETGFIMGIIFTGIKLQPRTALARLRLDIKHFDYHTAPRAKGKYGLLIIDSHESHHSTEFEHYCRQNNIITLWIPLHSSHYLQPLDVGCFWPLKQAYGRQIEHLIRMYINHVSKLEFLYAFPEAFFTSMMKEYTRWLYRC
ncbi:DDE-domain-containing protein [Parathielavia appendiculata]|uniref:DDE-domain-containing protein n=1 Tax=Parathielavia appendiculata TaxID=2587402 RepID=A0AAN6U5F7_9PEZI|nr:DDE-domain-containing protein [Parathielavia appendiculata]